MATKKTAKKTTKKRTTPAKAKKTKVEQVAGFHRFETTNETGDKVVRERPTA